MIRKILFVVLCTQLILVNAIPINNFNEDTHPLTKRQIIEISEFDDGTQNFQNNQDDNDSNSDFDNDFNTDFDHDSDIFKREVIIPETTEIVINLSPISSISQINSLSGKRVKKEITEKDQLGVIDLNEIDDDLNVAETHVFRPLFSYRVQQIQQKRRIRQNSSNTLNRV